MDSNSPFARHLESKVVTFARLMNFKLSILIDLSQYLEMEVADSVTKKVLSLQILKAYKNCISVDSSLNWWVYGDFVLCLGGRVEFCKMY